MQKPNRIKNHNTQQIHTAQLAMEKKVRQNKEIIGLKEQKKSLPSWNKEKDEVVYSVIFNQD